MLSKNNMPCVFNDDDDESTCKHEEELFRIATMRHKSASSGAPIICLLMVTFITLMAGGVAGVAAIEPNGF